jgi:septum formation protein
MNSINVILASASKARLELLSGINIHPIVTPADVDESEFPGELPNSIALRLAQAKAQKVASEVESGYIIGADTVAAVGRRVMPKALDSKMVEQCLRFYSGRRHKLYTGVHIIRKDGQSLNSRSRVVETIVKFKPLTESEIGFYSNCGEGVGKAGGYSIQGSAQAFVSFISGSFSNIIGLPLFETRGMLESLGYQLYN